MNVIETLRKKITTCPLMKTFNAVHMDYTEPNDGQAGLFFNGASLVRRSVEGDSDWQARFTLYTFCDTFEDYQRISASNFLLGLTYYLQSLSGIEIVENVILCDCAKLFRNDLFKTIAARLTTFLKCCVLSFLLKIIETFSYINKLS